MKTRPHPPRWLHPSASRCLHRYWPANADRTQLVDVADDQRAPCQHERCSAYVRPHLPGFVDDQQIDGRVGRMAFMIGPAGVAGRQGVTGGPPSTETVSQGADRTRAGIRALGIAHAVAFVELRLYLEQVAGLPIMRGEFECIAVTLRHRTRPNRQRSGPEPCGPCRPARHAGIAGTSLRSPARPYPRRSFATDWRQRQYYPVL
jgi:hypothetical protein